MRVADRRQRSGNERADAIAEGGDRGGGGWRRRGAASSVSVRKR